MMAQFNAIMRNLGTIQNSAEMISEPIGLDRSTRCQGSADRPSRNPLRTRNLSLWARQRCRRRFFADCSCRREGRHRRSLRCRQDDAGQSAAAFLRSRRRAHPDRWTGYSRRPAKCAARRDRHGDAGHSAAQSFHPRQYSFWSPESERGSRWHKRRGGRRRISSSGRWRTRRAARGLCRPCRRARRQTVRRPAPAHRDCPRHALKDAPILVLDEATSALDSRLRRRCNPIWKR